MLLLLLLAWGPAPPARETHPLRYRVVDANGEPVQGARVTVEGASTSAFTDARGWVTLAGTVPDQGLPRYALVRWEGTPYFEWALPQEPITLHQGEFLVEDLELEGTQVVLVETPEAPPDPWIEERLEQPTCIQDICLPAESLVRWSPARRHLLAFLSPTPVEHLGLTWAPDHWVQLHVDELSGTLDEPTVLAGFPLLAAPVRVQVRQGEVRLMEGCLDAHNTPDWTLPRGLCVGFTDEEISWILPQDIPGEHQDGCQAAADVGESLVGNLLLDKDVGLRAGPAWFAAYSVSSQVPGSVHGTLSRPLVLPDETLPVGRSLVILRGPSLVEHLEFLGAKASPELDTLVLHRGVHARGGPLILDGVPVHWLGADRPCARARVSDGVSERGWPVQAGEACFRDGQVESFTLSRDHPSGELLLAGGEEVRLTREGELQSFVLAATWEVPGFKLPAGTRVELGGLRHSAYVPPETEMVWRGIPLMQGAGVQWNDELVRIHLAEVTRLDGLDLAPGVTTYALDGQVLFGTLAAPAVLEGCLYPAGFSFLYHHDTFYPRGPRWAEQACPR